MKQLTSKELRDFYLKFFESHNHAIIPSSSIVPENDPTVLFTTAGMHPLVPYLLGESHPAGNRLCDVQKCIRTSDTSFILCAIYFCLGSFINFSNFSSISSTNSK